MMEQYYDAFQIAELLHKKPDTVRKMITHGDFGETLNSGRKHLVSEPNLKAYISAHTGQSYVERTYNIRVKRSKRMIDCMAKI
jgi:hypothetical protein